MTRRRRITYWLTALVAVVTLAGAAVVLLAPERYFPWDTASIPSADSSWSPEQARIVELARAEHQTQRPGTFYAEGVTEPWCADFVSWIMREAGQPLSNPNSGHWRIPGVYTLQEHYQAEGRYEPSDGSYRPTVGDVVLYDNVIGVGQHTNIVVAADGDSITTVGGNELGKIRVHDVDWRKDSAVIGFGRLAPAPEVAG
ncbi:CHAP domain-containing protein [Tomitella biformata]|uniref:CHAP domain-containing protein n=1 Tax=Tomitella biformata TaxID=630403 RepID=UPI0004677767|nr:CHAP domain-containing protein [Tomitella biformata]